MEHYQNIAGIVCNIQRFTIHDGPGIRTGVFLKGCNLRCKWCSNPESLRPNPEIALHSSKCLGVDVCKQCLSACHVADLKALELKNGKVSRINRHICNNCLVCATACPSDALFVFGKRMTVTNVLDAVLADREYYRKSGGVTFSGGEAFVQYEFLKECLLACKSKQIHTCVESALDVPAEVLIYIISLIDLIIFDLKVMNAEKHRIFTGKPNNRILENAMLLAETKLPLVIRVPIVPGHNDDIENITATARFIKKSLGNRIRQVQLLRYRPLGLEKYDALGKPYPLALMSMPKRAESEKEIENLAQIMSRMGLPAVAGTTTPFQK